MPFVAEDKLTMSLGELISFAFCLLVAFTADDIIQKGKKTTGKRGVKSTKIGATKKERHRRSGNNRSGAWRRRSEDTATKKQIMKDCTMKHVAKVADASVFNRLGWANSKRVEATRRSNNAQKLSKSARGRGFAARETHMDEETRLRMQKYVCLIVAYCDS